MVRLCSSSYNTFSFNTSIVIIPWKDFYGGGAYIYINLKRPKLLEHYIVKYLKQFNG